MVDKVKPRERILNVADELFYQQGIHATGIDEIVARSGAAKTTLYWHFQSKDLLVAAYLRRRSEQWQVFLGDKLAQDTSTPHEQIEMIFSLLAAGCEHQGFRGCPFINAAAEFPDPTHPARVAIAEHRAWLHGVFTRIATRARAEDPETFATWLCMLYDAAMISSQVDENRTEGIQESPAAKAKSAVRTLVTATFPTAPTLQTNANRDAA